MPKTCSIPKKRNIAYHLNKILRQQDHTQQSEVCLKVDRGIQISETNTNVRDIELLETQSVEHCINPIQPIEIDQRNPDPPEVQFSHPIGRQQTSVSTNKQKLLDENAIISLKPNEFMKHLLNNYNIPRTAGNILLKFFKHNLDVSLPSDTRTLMKTPRKHNVQSIFPGKYIHISLLEYMKCFSKSVILPNNVDASIFIDGFEVSKSSTKGMWIILAKFHNLPAQIKTNKPCIIGLYCGKKPPSNCNMFLAAFVNDVELLSAGVNLNGNLTTVSIIKYITDSSARSFVTGIRGHCSPNGCPKCSIVGLKLAGRNVFRSGIEAALRTNDNFGNDALHHKHATILESICDELITKFPIDYMHNVLKGVMNKLLRLWIQDSNNSFITKEGKEIINEILLKMAKFQSKDFSRKCRSLNDLGYFKATELRFFLLYAGKLTTFTKSIFINYFH